jgi:hypothetical protein
MSRGAAIAAPVGRADDFSWPRAEAKEPAPTQVEVVPVAPSPMPAAPPATKDAAGKNAAKKPADAKKESVPNAAPAGLRRRERGSTAHRATAIAGRRECALMFDHPHSFA